MKNYGLKKLQDTRIKIGGRHYGTNYARIHFFREEICKQIRACDNLEVLIYLESFTRQVIKKGGFKNDKEEN